MTTLETVMTTIFACISLQLILVFIKNYVTWSMHNKISVAIFKRAMHYIGLGDYDEANKVSYDDMEEYEYTLLKFWDWGYKHILPPEKFELIKDYIK